MSWGRGLFVTVICLFSAMPVRAITADEILKRVDDVRIPAGDFRVSARVVSIRANGKSEQGDYEVVSKGRDRTLIKTLAPAADRGTSILMSGSDLWVFLESVAKPVRIPLQQRLLGEVANGDLARMNFHGDYTPTLTQTAPSFYKLDLRAKTEDLTYGAVQLWVDRKTFRPIKAAFTAASGRLLKVGTYSDFRSAAGRIRPMRLELVDAVNRGNVSTIYYDEIVATGSLPDKLFSKDYLKKLKY